MNKYSILTPVYNCADFVKQALESIEPIAHEIIIVEGAWNPSLPQRSEDGTIDLIEEFKSAHPSKTKIIYYDSDPKIEDFRTNTYIPTVLANQLRAKRLAAHYMTGDWFFMVDSDEIYKYEDLLKLDEFIEVIKDPKRPLVLRVPAFVFYFDYNFGTREHFTRISRILNNAPHIEWEDQVYYGLNIVPEQLDLDEEIILMYHYGYIGKERVATKMTMWREDMSKDWYEKFLQIIKEGKFNDKENYHLFSKIGYGQKFEHFDGTHPKCILDKGQIE